MKIQAINYNWYATPENGEEFTNRTIDTSYNGVVLENIKEHGAMGDGDKWYYDLSYSDGSVERIFNPNHVFFIN